MKLIRYLSELKIASSSYLVSPSPDGLITNLEEMLNSLASLYLPTAFQHSGFPAFCFESVRPRFQSAHRSSIFKTIGVSPPAPSALPDLSGLSGTLFSCDRNLISRREGFDHNSGISGRIPSRLERTSSLASRVPLDSITCRSFAFCLNWYRYNYITQWSDNNNNNSTQWYERNLRVLMVVRLGYSRVLWHLGYW